MSEDKKLPNLSQKEVFDTIDSSLSLALFVVSKKLKESLVQVEDDMYNDCNTYAEDLNILLDAAVKYRQLTLSLMQEAQQKEIQEKMHAGIQMAKDEQKEEVSA